MKYQRFEKINHTIREAFLAWKRQNGVPTERLKFSWSNWGFGLESFDTSCTRLEKAEIHYIELPGNHHGPDLGYKPAEVLKIMEDHGGKIWATSKEDTGTVMYFVIRKYQEVPNE